MSFHHRRVQRVGKVVAISLGAAALVSAVNGEFSRKPLPAEQIKFSCKVTAADGGALTTLSGTMNFSEGSPAATFDLRSDSPDFPGGRDWQSLNKEARTHQYLATGELRDRLLVEYEFRLSDWPGEPTGYVAVRTHYNLGRRGPRPSGWVGAGVCTLSQAPFR